jgi:hypothetical protein
MQCVMANEWSLSSTIQNTESWASRPAHSNMTVVYLTANQRSNILVPLISHALSRDCCRAVADIMMNDFLEFIGTRTECISIAYKS